MTRWLHGDMHCHCERHDLVEAMFDGVDERLDFVALTNHAQKPIMEEQAEMIGRARELLPGFPIFYGLEWNAPVGVHINVIFPPSPNEAVNALAFARAHDRGIEGSDPSIESAMATLRALPKNDQPILFFNHPAAQPQFLKEHIDAFQTAAGPDIFVGVEAFHGHQGTVRPAPMDHFSYPSSCVGGLCDHVYERRRHFALLSHSDFHVHKQEQTPDYPLGVFSRSMVGISDSEDRARAVFAGLRAGRTCASMGRWLELKRFSVGNAGIGETWKENGNEAVLCIEVEAAEPIRQLEVIGQFREEQPPGVLFSLGEQPRGELSYEIPVPAGATGFVRLRAVAASDERPPPAPPAPRLFLSSAVLLGTESAP